MPDKRIEEKELFEHATSAALKTIAGDKELEVEFSGELEKINNTNITLPALPEQVTPYDISKTRGKADSIALRHKYHDINIHKKFSYNNSHVQNIFNSLEQARYESMGSKNMMGIEANLENILKEECIEHGYEICSDTTEAPLDQAVYFKAREALTGAPPPIEAKGLMNIWKDWLEQNLSNETLKNLAPYINNQEDFSEKTMNLLAQIDLPSDSNTGDKSLRTGESDNTETDSGSDTKETDSIDDQSLGTSISDQLSGDGSASEELIQLAASLDNNEKILTGESVGEQPSYAQSFQEDSNFLGEYHTYTTQFDEIIHAKELSTPDELKRLRQSLDQQLKPLQNIITRLANKLQRRLMAQQSRSWSFDQEEGILDSTRLSRVIANPSTPLSYKTESDIKFRDTVVSLLIDNSGSMRGRPITVAALSTNILARTLERCGVKVEILGFTTRAWKGGASREKWISDGKPTHSGRLNDLRHIIYKEADAPWRHARNNLGLMLREGLLKENIDGEALLWAHNRLSNRPEQRKILMVISDGAPVDDSTLSANNSNYLELHLRAVIDWIETKTPIELTAIGIGHDVTRYYKNAVTIMDVTELGGVLVDNLAELFKVRD